MVDVCPQRTSRRWSGWKGAERVSQQQALGRRNLGTRTAHPYQRCVAWDLRSGREPLCGSVISGLSFCRRSKRYAVLAAVNCRLFSPRAGNSSQARPPSSVVQRATPALFFQTCVPARPWRSAPAWAGHAGSSGCQVQPPGGGAAYTAMDLSDSHRPWMLQ